MRTTLIFALLLYMPVHAQTDSTSQAGAARGPFGVRSGVVHWRTSIDVADGLTLHTALSFADFGRLQRAETTVEGRVFGTELSGKDIVVLRDSTVYTYTDGRGTVARSRGSGVSVGAPGDGDSPFHLKFRLEPRVSFVVDKHPVVPEALSDSALRAMGVARRIGEILGRPVVYYRIVDARKRDTTEIALWRGIPLYFAVTQAGVRQATLRAESIDEDAQPDERAFLAPENREKL